MAFQLPVKLQAARIQLSVAFPYFNHIFWSLEPVSAPGLQTMGVDRYGRWYVDTEVCSQWPLGEVVMAFVHEIGHLINRHPWRLEKVAESDPFLANVAGDLAINDWLETILPDAQKLLRAQGEQMAKNQSRPFDDKDIIHLQMGKTWLYPATFNLPTNKTSEEYAELLKNNPAFKKMKKEQEQLAGDAGKIAGGGGAGQPRVGTGKCGSCAHGQKEPWELGPPDKNSPDVGKRSGLNKEEIESKSLAVAKDVLDHCKSRGVGMGGLERWAGELLGPPKIPWENKLTSAARRAYSWATDPEDETWERFGRRSTTQILFPGTGRPVPIIAYVMDVSGSMGKDDIDKITTECQGVLASSPDVPLHVVVVDDGVQLLQSITDIKEIKKFKGGGGTDMRIGIEAACKQQPPPQIIIVGTDGYTPWPDRPIPGVYLVAVMTQRAEAPPKWIDTVYLDDMP